MASKKYYKLQTLSMSVGERVLRKEHNAVYPAQVFGGPEKAKELEEKGFIVEVDYGSKSKDAKKSYDEITTNELKDILADAGANASGNKKELYDRYLEL